jgi:hypothetical protein
MRILDRKFRRTLARSAGVALMTLCAAGIADTIATTSGGDASTQAQAGTPSILEQLDRADAAPREVAAKAGRTGQQYVDLESPAAATGPAKRDEDAEIALLLDWHQDANNVSGALHPEEMTHPN